MELQLIKAASRATVPDDMIEISPFRIESTAFPIVYLTLYEERDLLLVVFIKKKECKYLLAKTNVKLNFLESKTY